MNFKDKNTTFTFISLVLALLIWGCSKVELMVPKYENLDVLGFENLVLSGGDGNVTAQWNRIAAEDVDYVLVRYIDSTSNGKSLQTRRYARDRQQITIGSLQNFKPYSFTFLVVDHYGNTSDSIVASATPISEIQNVFAKGGDTEGSVDIVWEDPVDPFGTFSGVSFYDESERLLGSVERDVQSITITGLPPGEEINIRAKIKLGDVYSKGIVFNASPRLLLPPPGEVSELVVKGKTNVLELNWTNPTDENFDFVEIYWGEGTDISQATNLFLGQVETLPGERKKTIIRNLVNGNSYVVLIKTSDAHGNASEGTVSIASPKNTVHVGNINIASQSDADNFNADVTYIQGNLTIENATNLTNLDKFKNLDSISGQFLYKNNSSWSFTTINHFENLQKINGSLTLESIWPSAHITFPMLRQVGQHFMVRYVGLASIAAPQLQKVSGDLYFLSTGALSSLDFSSLTRIGARLLFADAPNLTNLNGFSALNHVGSHFVVGQDPWGAGGKTCGFTNYCGVRNLMQSGFIGGNVIIEAAPFTPSRSAIVAGNCSQ